MRRSVAISLFFHVTLLFLLLNALKEESKEQKGGGDKGKGGTESNVTIRIIDKYEGAGGDIPCPKWYGGIGIMTSMNAVTSVALGYPAHKEGVLVGDTLLTDPEKIRGEVGTEVVISIVRGNEILVKKMTREKICEE